MAKQGAIVGVAEHGNSAELVTLAADGVLLDRRRVHLTNDLPTHPYHHEGSWAVGRYANSPWAKKISLGDAIALVERVHVAADRGAKECLKALAASISTPIDGIAIRECAKLPSTIKEIIVDSSAASMADSVMYRQALAAAARARGWSVYWYDRDGVFAEAAKALGVKSVDPVLNAMGKTVGSPWQARHKLAAAAALAAKTQAQLRAKRVR